MFHLKIPIEKKSKKYPNKHWYKEKQRMFVCEREREMEGWKWVGLVSDIKASFKGCTINECGFDAWTQR